LESVEILRIREIPILYRNVNFSFNLRKKRNIMIAAVRLPVILAN
jgi:hypothetical protein